ncbi:HdeD family acid-resistance protein [Pseudactinotalea suaedae]|uniref:HdeD family acid-resistance protein n=1 Tax=Pseudactinotalea suaedae TaxID=1524924 RepID=UPI0012E198EC|nr:HdeD family acid-resistance protein [Pseudactinotalea suaedae]
MTTTPAPVEARTLATTVWWLVLVQGILAIAFGAVAMFFTGATLLTIMVFFGVYSILDGVLALWGGVRNRQEGWGWLVFQGIAGVAVGMLALRYPSTTVIALTLLVAFWALVIGAIRIWGAFELRSLGAQGWIWALVAGAAAVLFGLALVVSPGYGAAALVWLIGITTAVFGIALVVNAFLVRKVVEDFADDGVINSSSS